MCSALVHIAERFDRTTKSSIGTIQRRIYVYVSSTFKTSKTFNTSSIFKNSKVLKWLRCNICVSICWNLIDLGLCTKHWESMMGTLTREVVIQNYYCNGVPVFKMMHGSSDINWKKWANQFRQTIQVMAHLRCKHPACRLSFKNIRELCFWYQCAAYSTCGIWQNTAACSFQGDLETRWPLAAQIRQPSRQANRAIVQVSERFFTKS